MSDYAKALTDLWSSQGEAMLRAQEQAAKAMTESMHALMSGKFPGLPAGSPELKDFGKATDALSKLWSAAASTSSELATKLAKFNGTDREGTMAAVLGRIADPRQWLVGPSDMDEALSRMAEGPRLADLFDLERRYAKVASAWVQMRRRALEHNAVVLEAWLRAGKRFAEELGGHVGAENQSLDSKRVLSVWTEIANHELLQTQRSEPYLRTQREMIRATTELRIAQQELVEHLGRQYGFPTRTELDDLHRTVTELRRDLRRLRRASRAAPAAPVPIASSETEPKPAKRRIPRNAESQP